MTFWTRYKTSFTRKSVWRSILLFLVAFLLGRIFTQQIDALWVGEFLGKFPANNVVIDSMFLVFLVFMSAKVYKNFKFGLIPSLNSIVLFLLVALFYIGLRTDTHCVYYSFKEKYLFGLAYADAFLLLASPLILDFSSLKAPVSTTKHQDPLISDDYDPKIVADLSGNDS
jgi:hypothetical protein